MLKRSSTAELVPIIGFLVLAVFLFACGPAREGAKGAVPEVAGGDSPATKPADRPSGRDFETLDICALVPVAAVAKALGYEESSGSADASMGKWGTDCTYSFERGGGSSDYAMIWAYPPQLWAPEEKGQIENVSGLGDAAFSSKLASFAQMNVLLDGDLYLDTRANTPVQARALAELALERLAG